MEKYFFKKLVTSVLFVFFLFFFSVQNFKEVYKPLLECLKKEKSNLSSLSKTIKAVENTINENVYGKYKWIEGYGYSQKIMGKNEENNFEVIKDNEGKLHYTFFGNQPNAVYELVKRTKAFKEGIKNKDSKFIYLMPPDKYVRGYSAMPLGIPYNYANETADKFLELLNANDIDNIDFRKDLNNSGFASSELFFKTDHHWRIETAFWAFTQLVSTLKTEYGLKIDQDGFYTDKSNYNFIKYTNSYLGSMGRKTGVAYSGYDDFNLIYPKFKTSYSYYSKTGNQETRLEGRFEEALLTVSPFRANKEQYSIEMDKYSSYLFGNQGIIHIVNKEKTDGPKVLFIKDSYSVPVAAFLSTICSDIYLVDPRYYKDDIAKFTNSVDVDFVFMSFYPQDLTESFFTFYEGK